MKFGQFMEPTISLQCLLDPAIVCYPEPDKRSACSTILFTYYLRVMKNNFVRYLSSVYFVSQPLHVSGIFVAHHQEVYCIHKKLVRIMLFRWLSVVRVVMELFHPTSDNRQSSKKHNTYQLLYIYSILPDDGLQICPKYVE
jgi:hypothetical protein